MPFANRPKKNPPPASAPSAKDIVNAIELNASITDITTLLQAAPGIDLNVPEPDFGLLALVAAVGRESPTGLVSLLIERGASPNVEDLHGMSGMFAAAQACDVRLLKTMKAAGADFARVSAAPHCAEGLSEEARAAILAGTPHGMNAMHFAAQGVIADKPESVEAFAQTLDFLVEAGIDVNAKNSHGNTPLMVVLQQASLFKDVSHALKEVLTRGADLAVSNNDRHTPFTLANDLATRGEIDRTTADDYKSLMSAYIALKTVIRPSAFSPAAGRI